MRRAPCCVRPALSRPPPRLHPPRLLRPLALALASRGCAARLYLDTGCGPLPQPGGGGRARGGGRAGAGGDGPVPPPNVPDSPAPRAPPPAPRRAAAAPLARRVPAHPPSPSPRHRAVLQLRSTFKLLPKLNYSATAELNKKMGELEAQKRRLARFSGAEDGAGEGDEAQSSGPVRRMDSSLDEQQQERDRLELLREKAKKEADLNEVLIQQMSGNTIKYGQDVQLLHVKSGKQLFVDKRNLAELEKTCTLMRLVSEGSSACHFRFMPRYRFRKEGEDIGLGDYMLLSSVLVAGQNMHVSVDAFRDGRREVNCAPEKERAKWKAVSYAAHDPAADRFLLGGTAVYLWHAESDGQVIFNSAMSELDAEGGSAAAAAGQLALFSYGGDAEEVVERHSTTPRNRARRLVDGRTVRGARTGGDQVPLSPPRDGQVPCCYNRDHKAVDEITDGDGSEPDTAISNDTSSGAWRSPPSATPPTRSSSSSRRR